MLQGQLKFGAFPSPFCTQKRSVHGDDAWHIGASGPLHTWAQRAARPWESWEPERKGKCPKAIPTHLAHEPKSRDRGNRESPKRKWLKAIPTHLTHERKSRDHGNRESPKGKCPKAVPNTPHTQAQQAVWPWESWEPERKVSKGHSNTPHIRAVWLWKPWEPEWKVSKGRPNTPRTRAQWAVGPWKSWEPERKVSKGRPNPPRTRAQRAVGLWKSWEPERKVSKGRPNSPHTRAKEPWPWKSWEPKRKVSKGRSRHTSHTSPTSRGTVEIMRAHKESVQRLSQHTSKVMWCGHMPSIVVWSHVWQGTPPKCSFKRFLSIRVPHNGHERLECCGLPVLC